MSFRHHLFPPHLDLARNQRPALYNWDGWRFDPSVALSYLHWLSPRPSLKEGTCIEVVLKSYPKCRQTWPVRRPALVHLLRMQIPDYCLYRSPYLRPYRSRQPKDQTVFAPSATLKLTSSSTVPSIEPDPYSILKSSPVFVHVLDWLQLNFLWSRQAMLLSGQLWHGTQRFELPVSNRILNSCGGVPIVKLP